MVDNGDPQDLNDPEVWKTTGNEFFNKGQYEEAIKCYSKAIELNPDFIPAWNNLGLSLLKLGKIDEAKKCNEKIRKLNENTLKKQNNEARNQTKATEEIKEDSDFCPNCASKLPYKKGQWPRGVPHYCPDCGFRVDDNKKIDIHHETKDPKKAALLSIIPGLGQVYNGSLIRGLIFLFGTAIGLLLLIPGIGVWIFGIYDSYNYSKKINSGAILPKRTQSWLVGCFAVLSIFTIITAGIGISSVVNFTSGPEYVFQEYVNAWNSGDDDKIYSLLSDEASKKNSRTSIYNSMIGTGWPTVTRFSYESRETEDDTSRLIVNMDIEFPMKGRITKQKSFDLVKEENQWKFSKFNPLY